MAWVALIPLLPALAFVLLLPMPRKVRNNSISISVGAMVLALGLAVAAFVQVMPGGEHFEPVKLATFTVASLGGNPLTVGLSVDTVSAVMLLVVTIVGTCVQVYSLGYMHRDQRIGWFYAVLSLFTAAMLVVVLADDLLLLYAAWEVMGLCSYLLIGFWYEQEGPRKASQKAFLTTRVGDVGFAIALFVIFGAAGTFDLQAVLASAETWAPGVATAAALLLLFGAMGKSAQVPLHVWLPDAMAGPTPASALIHAATMVAAGVYLVARTLPIFEISGVALSVTLVVGAVTALVGGLLAAVQHDVKKVLAYSTISQLGYMFIALGAGGAAVSLFHLVTHAFFKSLLFLGAGVIIHAAHTQDMREMGGLSRFMPWTTATFTVGSLALAGVFPFSGFWSKDEILTSLWHGQHYVVFAVALLAAFVTAFYVTRLWFRVFAGPPQCEELHEAHRSMLAPMVLLAAITAVIGVLSPAFSVFVGHEGEWPAIGMALTSSAVAFSGIGLGWYFYGRRSVVVNTRTVKQRMGYVYQALVQKLYFDLTYERLIIVPYMVLTRLLAGFDLKAIDRVVNEVGRGWVALSQVSWTFDARAIDGTVNGVASAVRRAGSRARQIESGRVQTYQRLILGALVLLMIFVVVKGA